MSSTLFYLLISITNLTFLIYMHLVPTLNSVISIAYIPYLLEYCFILGTLHYVPIQHGGPIKCHGIQSQPFSTDSAFILLFTYDYHLLLILEIGIWLYELSLLSISNYIHYICFTTSVYFTHQKASVPLSKGVTPTCIRWQTLLSLRLLALHS